MTAARRPWLFAGATTTVALAYVLVMATAVGVGGFVVGALLALLPVPLFAGLALWVDRFEPEPKRLLVAGFLWGGASVTLAVIIHGIGRAVVGESLGGAVAAFYGLSISAPVFEEILKAAFLLFVFVKRPHLFGGVLDGIVYAIAVGLGFGVVENFGYYVVEQTRGAEGDPTGLFVQRGLLYGLMHPVMTSMTGIALGLAAERRELGGRRAVPILGLLGAIALHSINNSVSGRYLPAGYGIVVTLSFVLVAVVVVLQIRREGRIVAKHAPRDLVPDAHIGRLYSVRARVSDAIAAFRRGGVRAVLARDDYVSAVSAVAFHRDRAARGLEHGAETAYVERLRLLAPGADGGAPVRAAAPAAGSPAPASEPQKVCPDCAETVKAAARVCRYCGYRFAA